MDTGSEYLSCNTDSKLLEAQYKLEQLRLREQDLSSQLDVLNHERDSFALRLEHVRSDLQSQQAKFTTQEEELLQEIITLEERFQSQIETQHVLEEEIQELRAEIERQRSKSESPKRTEVKPCSSDDYKPSTKILNFMPVHLKVSWR